MCFTIAWLKGNRPEDNYLSEQEESFKNWVLMYNLNQE